MSQESFFSSQTKQPSWFQKHTILILLLVILIGLVVYLFLPKQDKVPDYISKEGRFQVHFFGNPQYGLEDIHIPSLPTSSVQMFTEKVATPLFCHVFYWDLPEELVQKSDPARLLDIGQFNVIHIADEYTSKDITLNGIPGRELTLKTKTEGAAVCRVYIDKNRLYQCLIASKTNDVSDPKIKQFLDSFQIINK